MPEGRHARWIMKLQQYDFEIKHRPGKSNANADTLSRLVQPKEVLSCLLMVMLYEKTFKIS